MAQSSFLKSFVRVLFAPGVKVRTSRSFGFRNAFLAIAALVLLAAMTSEAAPRRRLSGHVPPAVASVAAVDRLDRSAKLELSIGLPLRNEAEFDALLEQIYDPASTNYHHYLSPADFAERFGPTAEDYQKVIDFAQAHGLAVSKTFSNHTLVVVQGAATNIEDAFQLNLRVYPHPTENRRFFAPDTEPSVDASVPILDISGLDNYVLPHPMNLQISPAAQTANFQSQAIPPLTGSGPNRNFIGNDFRAAYAPNVSLTGVGQTVALFELDGYFPVDITNYKNEAHEPDVPVQNVLVNYDGTAGSNNVEVALDIELAISMAPGLSKVLVYEGTTGNSILTQMFQDNAAAQCSASWTYSINGTTTNLFREFAAAGVSFFTASGDSGEYKNTPATPTDVPFLTSVGGTTLQTSSAGGPWSSEIVWNWFTTGQGTAASSGGISTSYNLPTWQSGVATTANKASTTKRNIPDVALTADNIFVNVNNGSSGTVGGTSCAAPLWAGFAALMNQQASAHGLTNVGFINPSIYAIAKTANYTNAFHDVTTGNNTNANSSTRFPATTGYDLCTGLGSPNGANLIAALVPVPIITTQPADEVTSPGSNVTFSVQAAGTSLSYQWQENNNNIAGANSSAYTITNAQVSDEGNYSVIVSDNSLAVTSSVATLTMSAPPIFTLQPQDQSVPQGATVVFMGMATGTPDPTYQWQLNGADIPFATDTTLTIPNAQLSNAGTYTLVASNSGGATFSSNAVLIVQAPPAISAQPVSRSVNQGNSALFSVTATGTPTLIYQWQFNSNNISGATNFFYVVSNAQLGNSGSYDVIVMNDYGTITSSVATLTVNAPPIITLQPQGESLTVGDTANFSVAATGTPQVNYHWLFNNVALSDSARINGSQTANLTINGVLTSDAGNYQAVAANSFGLSNSIVVSLSVVPATPVITWTTPAAITYGSALTVTQLNVTATQPGTFAYSPALGTVPDAGTNLLSVIFTPSDAADYNSVTSHVSIMVLPVVLTVTAADASRAFGQANPVFTANVTGAVNGDAFTTAASSLATATNLPGTYPIVPSLSGTNSRAANYSVTLVNGSLTITNASPPTIARIDPHSGATNGGTTVIITGTGFQNGATINFGTLAAVSVTVTNDTNIIAVTPAAPLGAVDIILTNADGQTAVLTNAFTYVEPQTIDITPAQITSEPTNATAPLGGSAIFSLTATGAQPLVYQWLLNNTNLPAATNATLSLSDIQPSDAGMYQAIVTNAYGAATSSIVTLSVLGAPVSFTTPPGGLQISNGQFVLQLSGLTGQGPVIIQSSTNLIDWTPIYTNPPGFGQLQFTDTNASNNTTGFYRAVTQSSQ